MDLCGHFYIEYITYVNTILPRQFKMAWERAVDANQEVSESAEKSAPQSNCPAVTPPVGCSEGRSVCTKSDWAASFLCNHEEVQ